MNYVIKSILKKIFTQFLYIDDKGLDIQSGVIKLNYGNIKHQKLNQLLRPLNISIIASSFKHLLIQIPIIQITSKPIKLSIDTFHVVLSRSHQTTNDNTKDMQPSQSLFKNEQEEIENEMKQHGSKMKQVGIQQQKLDEDGYFKKLSMRILSNVEILMQKIQIKMIQVQQDGRQQQSIFNINHLNIKNSLINLQANIIKKILILNQINLKHNFGQILLKDLNICFNYNNNKISLITVINHLSLHLSQLPIRQISKLTQKIKITNKNKTKIKTKTKTKITKQQLQMNLYLKMNHFQLSSHLITLKTSPLQFKINNNQQQKQYVLNFSWIKIMNGMVQTKQNKSIIKLQYLQNSKQWKTNIEYEDNLTKQSLIKIKKIGSKINAKVYHLVVGIDVNQFKFFMDHYLNKEVQILMVIDVVKGVMGKLEQQKKNNRKKDIQIVQIDNKNIQIVQIDNKDIQIEKKVNKDNQIIEIDNGQVDDKIKDGQVDEKQKDDQMDENDKCQMKTQQQKQVIMDIDLMIYKIMVQIDYGLLNIKLFGTTNLIIRNKKIYNQSNLKHLQYKQKIKYTTTHLLHQNTKQSNQHHQQHDNNKIETTLKLHQLGITIIDNKIIQLLQIDAKIQSKQIIINGNTIRSQLSISLLHKLQAQKDIVIRDLAYYKQKHHKIIQMLTILRQTSSQNGSININSKQNIEQMNIGRKMTIYVNIHQIIASLGQLIQSQHYNQQIQINHKSQKIDQKTQFVSIIDVQIKNNVFWLFNQKGKLKTNIIAYIFSPYTLQRTPLMNEFQANLHYNIKSNQFSINIKNNLILLIDDQYINIIYKLLDGQNVWCKFHNKINIPVLFIQEISQHVPLFSQLDHLANHQIQQQEQYCSSIKIQSKDKRSIFWLHSNGFQLQMEEFKSDILQIPTLQMSQNSLNGNFIEIEKKLSLIQGNYCDYILRFIFNKLGNLYSIVLDYTTHIISYHKTYIFHYNNFRYTIQPNKDNKLDDGYWFKYLQDFNEEYSRYEMQCCGLMLKIDQLMSNQQFLLYGLYEVCAMESGDQKKRLKLYNSYILQRKINKKIHFCIMPFMIITNNSNYNYLIEIIDKKSEYLQKRIISKNTTQYFQKNEYFDYYLKQFTIKISILNNNNQDIIFQSQYFYFNTFFMVDQKTQTPIQLRSTLKNNYSKRKIILQESLLLKTKLIIIKNGLIINNLSTFQFIIKIRNKNQLEIYQYIQIGSKVITYCCNKIKQDSILDIYINKTIQNRIECKYSDFKHIKILSFNFCKYNDRFYNLLIRIQRRFVDNMQTIEIDNFIQIINLCKEIDQIGIEQIVNVKYQQKSYLPLLSTSLNKYNNKIIQIDDINKIYAEIFLTSKVSDYPLLLNFKNTFIALQEFIVQTKYQIEINHNHFILTLLKDMNNNKITFYITDSLYNKKMHYTILNNRTAKYFLLTDDTEYTHHFTSEHQNRNTSLQKLLIHKESFNCLLNRQNNDLLLCDEHQKHLQKINKKLLQKQEIKFQQYNFDSITLIDCCKYEKQILRKQLTTKNIQIHLKMFNKQTIIVCLQAITLRLLQVNKIDCLIQDVSIRNQLTKDYLLRIPEQTYLLFQANNLNQHFLLLKNVFIKCKNIIVNIKRQMPYYLINLVSNIIQRFGLNLTQEQEQLQPRKYREYIKKINGQTKLKNYINSLLLLIRNVCIHEIHLSLTIQIQNVSFSNVIILPLFQILNKFQHLKGFKDSISNFYLTHLLAKFPKLSFIMNNFKNPMNTIKLFFNLREAFKQKISIKSIIDFCHDQIPANPFLFSIQRWNIINNRLFKRNKAAVHNEKLIFFIYSSGKYLILTSAHIICIQNNEIKEYQLKNLQNVKLIKNSMNSQLIIKFKKGTKLWMIDSQKKCMVLLSHIEKLIY